MSLPYPCKSWALWITFTFRTLHLYLWRRAILKRNTLTDSISRFSEPKKVSRFIPFASNIFPFMDDLGQKINTFSLTRKHWLNHWHELTLALSVCATSFHKNCLNYYSHYFCSSGASSGLEITRIVFFTKTFKLVSVNLKKIQLLEEIFYLQMYFITYTFIFIKNILF